MADFRLLEIVGGVFSIIFALIGGLRLSDDLNLDAPLDRTMQLVSTNLFLIIFGVASAVMLILGSNSCPPFTKKFGFLWTWRGRGLFYLVMGCYVLPSVCPRYNNLERCLDNDNLFWKCAVIAAFGSIIFGVVVLILCCAGRIIDVHSTEIVGRRMQTTLVHILCAIASVGMLIVSAKTLSSINTNDPIRDLSDKLARGFIMLIFGLTSFITCFWLSGFVFAFFGFLESGWERGAFYLLVGCYIAGAFNNAADTNWNYFVFVSGGISVVVGIVLIVLGCS
eukprot:TRINITY_DN8134_c0_g1_i2.p1 TRINITY_DN8134_c0_g1~~TRINITY_DN8134_c0_g1_i2.p1  ORF type:complete len:280 (-),score=30.30 TRINITY_DN8134_c0_g1_i2:61-900(-)